MFEENFDAEKSIKAVAKIVLVATIVLVLIGVVVGLIIIAALGFPGSLLFLIGLAILAGGVILFFFGFVVSIFIWGFGDIVGNTRRMARGAELMRGGDERMEQDEDLPEV